MIEKGLCAIFASDYFYSAMLTAIARLHAEQPSFLPDLWTLAATNPARASGLPDRGEIAPGKRADQTLIGAPEGGTPAPRRTWAAGREAYAAVVAG